jgi:phage minor structural protein
LIKIYNQQLQLVAILENAYNVGYEKVFNEVWTASFSLPLDDPKNEECKPLYYAEIFDGLGERVELFRIIPNSKRRDESTMEVSYECEHVLATLLDNSLFRFHQITNYTTTNVLEYILNGQQVQNWVLGDVEFTRYFAYSWENENLLSALFSVPKPFDQQYQWTFDTTVFPWVLNLVEPDMDVSAEIRYKKNLVGIERYEDPTPIVTRIYPLGYGEGVNQLGIEKVNPTGLSYIEDAAAITKYGIRDYIWVDRRFQDATLLYNSAKVKLNEWKTPQVTYSIDAVEMKQITQNDIDKYQCGKVVRVIDEDFGTFEIRVVSENKRDCKGEPFNVSLEIGSKLENLGTTNADLERRQQINEIYAQGATNIDSHTFADNCDPEHPAVIRFYLPEDLVRINKMLLSFESSAFRAFSKATKGGGATTGTSSSGGGTTATSSSGGGVSTSTASGGGTSTSSANGGSHTHIMFNPVNEVPGSTPKAQFRAKAQNGTNVNVNLEAGFADIYTYGASGDHTHTFSVPAHSHNFTIPNHSHEVTVPNHSHTLTLPDHVHDILYGIFEGETPTAITVKVDGNTIPSLGVNENDIDIIPYLTKDSEGRINRGTWHEVEIIPNKMGRIIANIAAQVFLQSRGGGNF